MSSLAQSGLTTLFARHRGARRRRASSVVGPKQAEREEGKASSYTRGLTVEDRDVALLAAAARRRALDVHRPRAQGRWSADTGRLKRTDLVAGDGDFFASRTCSSARGASSATRRTRATPRSASSATRSRRSCGTATPSATRSSSTGMRCRVIGAARPTAITGAWTSTSTGSTSSPCRSRRWPRSSPKAQGGGAVCRSRPTTPSQRHRQAHRQRAARRAPPRRRRLPDLRLRRRS